MFFLGILSIQRKTSMINQVTLGN